MVDPIKFQVEQIKLHKNGITGLCQHQIDRTGRPHFWAIDMDTIDFENNDDGSTTAYFTIDGEYDIEVTAPIIS